MKGFRNTDVAFAMQVSLRPLCVNIHADYAVHYASTQGPEDKCIKGLLANSYINFCTDTYHDTSY